MGDLGFLLWFVGLSAMVFFSFVWLLDLNNRHRQVQKWLSRLFVDGEGQDLSKPLENLVLRLDESNERIERLQNELNQLMPRSIQRVGLVRFQALTDYGGDQSFALVLANVDGDGVVLSSIFAREGTRVYAKPLSAWTSSYSLSFEEEEAISQARGQSEP